MYTFFFSFLPINPFMTPHIYLETLWKEPNPLMGKLCPTQAVKYCLDMEVIAKGNQMKLTVTLNKRLKG